MGVALDWLKGKDGDGDHHRGPEVGPWRIAFRCGEKQFTRSRKTEDEREADAIRGNLEDTLAAIRRGWIVVPVGADFGAFILSNGKLKRKPRRALPRPTAATIGDLVVAYDASLPAGAKESNTLRTKKIDRRHIERILGATTPVEAIDLATAQLFIKARLDETHGKRAKRPIRAYTARKELKSFRHAWTWCHRMKLVRRYRSGRTIAMIVAATGLNRESVRLRLKRAGIGLTPRGARRGSRRLDLPVTEIVERYRAG
jgi:hypothetical protein